MGRFGHRSSFTQKGIALRIEYLGQIRSKSFTMNKESCVIPHQTSSTFLSINSACQVTM
jgi:hypothetical protein